MADLKVYTYRKCSTCRKALDWLDEQAINYRELPVRESPPTRKDLKLALQTTGNIRKILNTSSQDYRDLGLKDKLGTLSESEVFGLLQENGNLVKRPFVVADGQAFAGFKADEWSARLQ